MGKWSFLNEYIDIQLLKESNNTKIAKDTIDRFSLSADRESIRKYVAKRGKLIPNRNTPKEQPVLRTISLNEIEKSKTFEKLDTGFLKKRGSVKTYLIGGCFHFPFHNKKLFTSFLRIIRYLDKRLDGIVINGDYLDLMALSSHSKGQRILPGVSLEMEYNSGLDGLLEIKNAITHKDVRKMFNWGNHEDRYKRHMNNSDNSKYGGALLSPTEALKLHELKYEVNEDWKDGYFTLDNKVDVFHGIYCNKHSAAKHLEMFQRSCVFNHTHRVQSHHANGITAHNGGTMCDINHKAFSYMPRSQKMQWANAITVVQIDKYGNEYLQTLIACNDHFVFEGNVF